MNNKNVEDAISYIEAHTWSKTKLGLDRTRELLEKLGNPQNDLKFIHVAGSNGKGSVCAMLSSVLMESGLKVGLYTSPYLSDFTEQLRVNGENILGEELFEIVEKVKPVAESMEEHPSRFEILTAVGMLYFKKKNCDIVVLEVGLGGALDSTNVIPAPEVAVIMNIGLEHCEYLGNTIEEIAKNKAGIIKKGCDCVVYNGDKRAVDLFIDCCKNKNVPITVSDFNSISDAKITIDGIEFSKGEHKGVELPLIGSHQIYNASVAIDVISVLNKRGYNISKDDIYNGLSKVSWPARFEVLSREPLFILDGAHNPQCAQALSDTLGALFSNDKKFTLLMGVLADKDLDAILKSMMPFAKEVVCVTPNSIRALEGKDLAGKIDKEYSIPTEVCDSIKEGIQKAISKGSSVVAFGSLYMAGEIRDNFTIEKKNSNEG